MNSVTGRMLQTNLGTEAQHWKRPDAQLFNDAADPTTHMARVARLKEKHGNNGAGIPLAMEAKNWPRPSVTTGHQIDRHLRSEELKATGGVSLAGAAETFERPQNWHRPDTAPDAPNKGSNCTGLAGLGNQAEGFTRPPEADTTRNGLESEASSLGSGPPSQPKRRLNWIFVEWLMSLPYRWLDLPWLTRRKRLKMLGNAVDPLQALPFFEAIVAMDAELGAG